MDFNRAFVIALKIVAVDFVFGIILVSVAFYTFNLIATVVLSLLLVPVMTALAVFFILEEAENMINTGSRVAYDTHSDEERTVSRRLAPARQTEEARNTYARIMAGVDEVKFEPMINALIDKYRKAGYINPEGYLESRINERSFWSHKTKEQVIEELYREIENQKN
jgi:hypothetical protein